MFAHAQRFAALQLGFSGRTASPHVRFVGIASDASAGH
jgi:hypothetical protein